MINVIKNFAGSFYLDFGAESVVAKIAEVIFYEVYPTDVIIIHVQLFNFYFSIIKKRNAI